MCGLPAVLFLLKFPVLGYTIHCFKERIPFLSASCCVPIVVSESPVTQIFEMIGSLNESFLQAIEGKFNPARSSVLSNARVD